MLYNMIKAYSAILSAFGRFITPLFTFSGIFLLRLLVSEGMFLDKLLFPGLKKQKVEKPIIIVGNPRSGTTFLQRFLVDQKIGTGMKLWKMIFPSLTLQRIMKPLMPFMEKVSPARFHLHAAHETNLSAIETDDPALLFRFFDGFFVYGFFLAWAKEDLKPRFDPDLRDTSERDFKWFRKIWERNLISENQNRVVAKLFSLGVRIPKFLEHFPDAKILYTLRDPLETVPSGLSLVTGVLDGRFGFWKLPETKRNMYIDRLYAALLELSIRFHDDYVSGKIPHEKIMIVKFERMMQDFDNLMDEITDFAVIERTEELNSAIQKTAEKQRSFKSAHKYDLQKFGLTEERIRKDYEKIYSTFFNK
jgi:omega-hydroxy-beta-dihydromenaquinone-9 sulfotransferase